MNDSQSLRRAIDVVAAGHICLDIIPELSRRLRDADALFVPGGLVRIGPATVALGGSVANTGLALHRLGARTRLMGKIGDDLLGGTILESLRQFDASIAQNMIVAPGEATSYSIVISPPQVDRGFLHCSGANDTFVARDLDASLWGEARILHFGYPPLMHCTIADEGRGLADQFARARASGAIVSLDMAMPAEESRDWPKWLRHVLPNVDIFLPSVDELLAMMRPQKAGASVAPPSPKGDLRVIDESELRSLANELCDFGVPIVVVKLGDQGLYLRTTDGVTHLGERAAWSDFDWRRWRCRELLAPCFDVDVKGTTGSGDCTIAGFLMALLRDSNPVQALRMATAVGAHCVQSADATSNICSAEQIEIALQSSWSHRKLTGDWLSWPFDRRLGIFVGPADTQATRPTSN